MMPWQDKIISILKASTGTISKSYSGHLNDCFMVYNLDSAGNRFEFIECTKNDLVSVFSITRNKLVRKKLMLYLLGGPAHG